MEIASVIKAREIALAELIHQLPPDSGWEHFAGASFDDLRIASRLTREGAELNISLKVEMIRWMFGLQELLDEYVYKAKQEAGLITEPPPPSPPAIAPPQLSAAQYLENRYREERDAESRR